MSAGGFCALQKNGGLNSDQKGHSEMSCVCSKEGGKVVERRQPILGRSISRRSAGSCSY